MGREIRKFTQEEIDFIINNSDKMTLNKIRKTINCSEKALELFARDNNISFQKSNRWTKNDLEELKELAKTKRIEEIANKLGKSEKAVYQKAARLNITFSKERRIWNEEEDNDLKRLWGVKPLEKIAQKLNRSIYSIKVRANRLSLGPMYGNNPEFLTISNISEIFNIPRDRIESTWKNKGLKFRKKSLTKNYSYYCIAWEDMLDFLKENQDLWDSRKMQYNVFGEDEDWLIEKIKNDKTKNNIEYRKWTQNEIEYVELLFKNNKTPQEIALKLNRSENSIKIVLRTLGYSYKMPIHWKGKELKFLRENYKELSNEEIAEIIGRTPRAVQAKAQQLGYKKKN